MPLRRFIFLRLLLLEILRRRGEAATDFLRRSLFACF